MPMIMPTEIGQVTDQTQPAGKNLLDVMLNQAKENPWEKVREIIDTNYSKVIKGQEQELLNNAVDTFYRRREAGLDPTEAIKGLEARITGSKAFQDRAQNIRSSLIDQSRENRTQDQWEDLLRRTRLGEEANALAADYRKVRQQYGPQIASVWMSEHEQALKNNPYAYKAVMDVVGQDDNLLGSTPATAEDVSLALKNSLPNITEARTKLDRLNQAFHSLGLDPADLSKVPITEDVVAVIDAFAKPRKYEGKEYSDFYENMMGLYNIGMAEAKRLQDEAGIYGAEALILPAMKKFLQTRAASGLPFIGEYFQDTASANDFTAYLREQASKVAPLRDAWRDIEPARKLIEENPNIASDINAQLQQAISRAQKLSPEQREQYLGNVAADLLKKVASTNIAINQTNTVSRDIFGR